MDKDILYCYDAIVIGYVTSVNTNIAEVDPATIIPKTFQQYVKVLGKELVDKLSDHRPYDYAIDLKDSKQLLWGLLYPLNEMELQVLWDYLKKMLELGKIYLWKSPAAVPIIFIPKAHSQELRLYINYHSLNKVTITN
jgi:hypothetical protein